MRKEVRLGLGIGGVILAVMVVVGVVHSHSKPKNQQTNKTPVQPPDKTDGATDVTPPPDPGTGPTPVDTSAPPPPPARTESDAERLAGPAPADAGKSTDWERALRDGVLAAHEPIQTVTPTAGQGADRPGRESRDSRESHDPFGPPRSESPKTPGTLGAEASLTGRATPKPGATPRTHTVAEGETFSTIARAVYGNKKYYLLIAKANPSVVPERMRPGTVINLPELPAADRSERAARADRPETGDHRTARAASAGAAPHDSAKEYTVQPGDSLHRICTNLYGSAKKVDALYELNKDRIGSDPARLKLGMVLKLPRTADGRLAVIGSGDDKVRGRG